jgi:hypothetical protein
LRDVGMRQVNLVNHRDDLEILLHREMHVGHRLRFNPLGGVNDQQGAFTGAETPGNLVGEVHVPGGVDEVQLVGFAILGV